MKQIRRIFKNNVSFYSTEPTRNEAGFIVAKGLTVAVCDDVGDVLFEIGEYLEELFGFFPPIKIKSYVNYKVSAKAICQPEDEWDEEYGRRLAFNKLYQRQFKSILNNVLSNCQRRLDNVDNILSGILDRPTRDEILDEQWIMYKGITDEDYERFCKEYNIAQ